MPEVNQVSGQTESVPRGGALLRQIARFFRGAGLEAPFSLAIISASIAAPVLIRLSAPGAQSDIPDHAAMAASMVETGGWFSYSLWYALVYVTSSGSADPVLLREISVFFLVVAVVAKSLLVYYIGWAFTRNRCAAAVIAALLLVAMPILNPWHSHGIYLGQISPNVWHNSTQIFALPFSLAAFAGAVTLLRRPSRSSALMFGILIFMSTLAKPNYTLALLPVLGLMLLWAMRGARIHSMRQIAIVGFAFLPPVLLMAYQYSLVFGAEGIRQTKIGFAPFDVWSIYSENIPISIVVSLAGPVAVFLAVPRKWRSDQAIWLAWLVLAVSMLQFALLAEQDVDGASLGSANFFWGSYSAIFMVFVVSAIALARAYLEGQAAGGRRVALFTAFMFLSLHAGTGLYYMGRAGVSGFPVTRP